MRILIVFAHAEPASSNAAMLRAGVAALSAAGHEVKVSDLYAMGFDPVSATPAMAADRPAVIR